MNSLNYRSFLALLHDLAMVAAIWFAAYVLRFNFSIPMQYKQQMLQMMIWLVPLHGLIFTLFGLYRGIWRYASMADLKRIICAVSITSMLAATALLMFGPIISVPRSVLILYPMLLLLAMGGSRFIYRAWKDHQLYSNYAKQGLPVVVLGAGEAAIALVKDLARSSQWRVVALLDDDASMLGREVHGVKVLGAITRLTDVSKQLEVKHVIIAMSSVQHDARRRATDLATELGLEVFTVPAIDDMISGKISVSQIRRVEVEDLLRRDAVMLDNDGLHALITGHVVLVSGAGGSIGAELCRQVLKFHPTRLVCLDISEYALYQLEQELIQQGASCVFVTGDVKNEQRMMQLLTEYQPKVVFHAAAYKHVPLMERHNVAEALANNVLGTHVLARLAIHTGAEKFVLVSTDKAVNPTNVMGASKRLAEMVCQGLQGKNSTEFVIVRFGNVLGSSGSVIPKFRAQIGQGGPVTVTHPEITRFFMSITEASQLVMQAGLMGKGGEIFVLDMGDPVKITDLARDMIRLSGLHEDEIKIEFTGLRPGEKLYEELLADDELTKPTPHPKLRIASARKADKVWVTRLLKWVQSAQQMDESEIKKQLTVWVEEYAESASSESASPSETIH